MPEIQQHHTIWTPELVELSMPLAGVARRCLARLIDQLILVVIYIAIIVLTFANPFKNISISIILGILMFVLSDFIYFWAFHAFMKGQSPGKKCLGIRVVTPRGGKINAVTALIRSLFNIVDMILFTGGISALMILATDQEKRIADFAAGTIVIIER
jgi:uncharacterized RDD family membrane protein YckC